MATILAVDDENAIRDFMAETLADVGPIVVQAAYGSIDTVVEAMRIAATCAAVAFIGLQVAGLIPHNGKES